MTQIIRTPVREKSKQIAQLLIEEQPNYDYLREIFRHLRTALHVVVPRVEKSKRSILPIESIQRFCDLLKKEENPKNRMIVQTLLYTGVRLCELTNIKIKDINFKNCHIQIQKEYKGQKRIVLFPSAFRETLQKYADKAQSSGGIYLFETLQKQPYTDRGIRKMIYSYSQKAGLDNAITANGLRAFWLSWLKQQGIEDAMLQPYSGHKSRYSLEQYDKTEPLKIENVQAQYESVMQRLML
jgi:integrase/recombinase XerD